MLDFRAIYTNISSISLRLGPKMPVWNFIELESLEENNVKAHVKHNMSIVAHISIFTTYCHSLSKSQCYVKSLFQSLRSTPKTLANTRPGYREILCVNDNYVLSSRIWCMTGSHIRSNGSRPQSSTVKEQSAVLYSVHVHILHWKMNCISYPAFVQTPWLVYLHGKSDKIQRLLLIK